MHEAIDALSITTESVRYNLYQRIDFWLLERESQKLPEARLKYQEPPWFASQEAHSFEWNGSHSGWIDILRKDNDISQVVLNLSYPRKSWLSKHGRDWQRMNDEAEFLFGQGQTFGFATRQSVLYEAQDIRFLLSSYEEGKQAFIEIKAAKEAFCS